MKILRIAAGLAAIAILLMCRQIAGAQDVAGAYQITPAHDGQVVTPNLHFPLKTRWTFDLGAVSRHWVGCPLIAQGKVFSLAGGVDAGSMDLYALDVKTGKIAWGPVAVPSGQFYSGGLAYENGHLFVVPERTSSLSYGEMYAYDATTGNQAWSTELPGQFMFGSIPTAYKGIVYINGSGSGGTFYAVRESDGALLWTAMVENGDDCSPAIAPDGVFANYSCPHVYKFDPVTGALLWHYAPGCSGGGGVTPVYYAGYVYARDLSDPDWGGQIFDARTGDAIGSFDPGYHDAPFPPTFYGNLGFYTQGGPYLFRSSLTAIDVRTNQKAWTLDASNDLIYSTSLVVNGVIYNVTHDGLLNGYEALTGRRVNKTQLEIDPTGGTPQGIAISGINAAQGLIVVGAGSKITGVEGRIPPFQIRLTTANVAGGLTTVGGVILTKPAPKGGVTVPLINTNPNARIPASVFVPAGRLVGTFNISTSPTATLSPGLIAGTLHGITESSSLMVTPPGVSLLKLVPGSVRGGTMVKAFIALNAPAPPGGTVVSLSSDATSIASPATATITIGAGRRGGMASINTFIVSNESTAHVTASANGVSQTGSLVVTP